MTKSFPRIGDRHSRWSSVYKSLEMGTHWIMVCTEEKSIFFLWS